MSRHFPVPAPIPLTSSPVAPPPLFRIEADLRAASPRLWVHRADFPPAELAMAEVQAGGIEMRSRGDLICRVVPA